MTKINIKPMSPVRLMYGSIHLELLKAITARMIFRKQQESPMKSKMEMKFQFAWEDEGSIYLLTDAPFDHAWFEDFCSSAQRQTLSRGDTIRIYHGRDWLNVRIHPDYLSPSQRRTEATPAAPGYEALRSVLDRAHDQAAKGKGAARHADGLPFHKQRMQLISDLLKTERGMAFQACKKLTEGLDLPTTEAKVAELLGAINYIAGIVVYLEKNDQGHQSAR